MTPPWDRTEDLRRDLLYEEEVEEQSYGCFICGNHPFFTGRIEKSNPNRSFRYWLCKKCHEKPKSESIVKKIIDYYETTLRCNPSLLDHRWEC